MAFKEESTSFAVGHMALAYLIGKSSARVLKVPLNTPIILVLSIIPDADILFGVNEWHRGPTHSLIAAFLIFVPFFVLYRQKALPYFLALISHSLIADFITGGNIMLLWPLTPRLFGLNEFGLDFEIWSPVNVALEWTLFALATVVMFKTGELASFFHNQKPNLLLAIPVGTVLLPTIVSYPLQVPFLLMPPHVFYLVLFSVSVLIALSGLLKRSRCR
ncbi:MAG: metal-dependent hydrolase [Candidatus Bathyarchaeota archaeon]|nr:metal-dependent hydrolase [Candidatus Bathyarchaeota archaeon]